MKGVGRVFKLRGIGYHLAPEQETAMVEICSGRNVFFTGSAGTGKSLVLQLAVDQLRQIHGNNKVFVTAMTGKAAVQIEGTTVHSFAGIGLAEGTIDEIIRKVRNNPPAVQRWRRARVLVIDEISMMDARLFTTLECVARAIRNPVQQNEVEDEEPPPFGGIQVVLCGDFLQLPPVDAGGKEGVSFAFTSSLWHKVLDTIILFRIIHRQRNLDFVNLLQAARFNQLTDEQCNVLDTRIQKVPRGAVQLMTHKKQVDQINTFQLAQIDDPPRTFRSIDHCPPGRAGAWLMRFMPVGKEVVLKIGAQVMLIRNLDFDAGLVNGSQGVVVGFSKTGQKFPIVEFCNGIRRTIEASTFEFREQGERKATRIQVPLILAWAITVHKSQGMTLDQVHACLSNAFDFGMIYVAISRCRTLDGLTLSTRPDWSDLKVHPYAVAYYRYLDDCGPVIHLK